MLPPVSLYAHSFGEASAQNRGHGPETSRDAYGQDRSGRLKARSPVAEGSSLLSLYVVRCQSSTREGLLASSSACLPADLA